MIRLHSYFPFSSTHHEANRSRTVLPPHFVQFQNLPLACSTYQETLLHSAGLIPLTCPARLRRARVHLEIVMPYAARIFASTRAADFSEGITPAT